MSASEIVGGVVGVLVGGGIGYAVSSRLSAKWFRENLGMTKAEAERSVRPLKRRPTPPFQVSHPRQPYDGSSPRLRSAVFRGNSREERRGELEE